MKTITKKSFLFIVAMGATALAGYAFHFIASRRLGPARYGEYTALMALMLAFARPLEALSPLVARVIVENNDRDWKEFICSFFYLALIVGSVLGGALLIFSLIWGPGLNLPLTLATVFGGLTLVFWSFLFVFRGVLQGHFRDESYIFNRPLELSGRLIGGAVLFAMGGGLASAIFSSFLGAAGGIAHILITIKDSLRGWRDLWNFKIEKKILNQFWKIMLIWLAGGFFIGLDMILAKRLFSPEESGIYAIANLIGKGMLVYAFVILPILYPRLVKHRLRGDSLRYIGMGLLYSAGIFLAGFLLFLIWGETIITQFFGEAYRQAASLVPAYLIAVFPISLHFAVINLESAIGGWGECFFIWLALAAYFVILWFSPPDFYSYLWRIGITQVLCAGAEYLFLLWREKS